jgi:F-type H+-transporting ATPase subunit b
LIVTASSSSKALLIGAMLTLAAIGPVALASAAEPSAGARPSTVTAAEAAEKEKEAEHVGLPEEIQGVAEWHTDLAIWSFVVFLILLAILTKFAWKPIVAGLEKREQGIEENIAAAHRANDEAKVMLGEYEKKLAGAADQVRQMLDGARRDAEQTKLEIVAEAKGAAQLEQQRGVREVRTAVDQALKELSEKSTNLAVDLAGKIVRSKLNPADHSRLVQEAIAEFGAKQPSVN